MKAYRFLSSGAGEVDTVCNKWAAEGWEVDKFFRDGNRFYLLLARERTSADEAVAPRKPGRPRKVEELKE